MDTKFYKDNEIRIGEDYTTFPPQYYSSLRNGFQSYFDTFLDMKDSIIFLIDFNWERKGIGFNFKVSYDKVVSTIIDFHRFFELLMKDLLCKVNPYLGVRLESPKEFVKFFIENTPPKELKSVEFSGTLERLRVLIQNVDENSEFVDVKKFKFLLDAKASLKELSWWRNRLTHNGNKIPNIISLDYLISQKIIPLINKVVKIQSEITGENHVPYYFETATGINIIERIAKIKFTQKELILSDGTQRAIDQSLAQRYIELYQLKALGRAAMNYGKISGININTYTEYHRIQHKDSHKLIKFQEQAKEYYKTYNCLCCGNLTLATFKELIEGDELFKEQTFIWSRCLVCDYGISNKLGNPKDSNITDIDIFG